MYRLDRMKQILAQVVDNDDKNNLLKFEKIHCFLTIWMKKWSKLSLKLIVISILLNVWTVKFLKTSHTVSILKK